GTTFIVPNPGTYTITVRDGNGCTDTVEAKVFDFFSITADASSLPTCNAGDGTITVSTSGGSGNFEYQLINGVTDMDIGGPQSDPEFHNLAPGYYKVLVTDLASNTIPLCSDMAEVTVSTVTPPEIAATAHTDISCNGADDGSLSIELVSGTDTDGPFEYFLYVGNDTTPFAGPQNTAIFDELPPNTYQVEVVSERGCVDRSGDIIIDEPSSPMATAINTEFSCNPSSNQFSTAIITIYTDTNGDGTGTPTGTGSYTYSMNDGTPEFDGTNFQTSNSFEVIDNGADQTIVLTARDQNGCEETATVQL